MKDNYISNNENVNVAQRENRTTHTPDLLKGRLH